MPVLFALSGIFLAKRLLRGWRWDGAGRRAADTYYLYVIWLVIYYLVSLVIPAGSPANRIDSLFDLLVQVFVPATTLWFILALAAYALVIAAFVSLRIPPWAVLAFGVVLWSASQFGDQESLSLRVVTNFIFFAVGAYFSNWLKAAGKADAMTCYALVGVFVAVAALLGIPVIQDFLPLALLASLAAIPATIAISAVLVQFPLVAAITSFVGRRALGVYVLHAPVLMLTVAYFSPGPLVKWVRNPLVDGLFAFLLTVAVVTACLVLHSALRRIPGNPMFARPRTLEGAGPGIDYRPL